MLQKIALAAFVAVCVVLVLPAAASAYGAAHVGYTHVGPNGVYHAGTTVAHGPGGTYAHSGRTARIDTSSHGPRRHLVIAITPEAVDAYAPDGEWCRVELGLSVWVLIG